MGQFPLLIVPNQPPSSQQTSLTLRVKYNDSNVISFFQNMSTPIIVKGGTIWLKK